MAHDIYVRKLNIKTTFKTTLRFYLIISRMTKGLKAAVLLQSIRIQFPVLTSSKSQLSIPQLYGDLTPPKLTVHGVTRTIKKKKKTIKIVLKEEWLESRKKNCWQGCVEKESTHSEYKQYSCKRSRVRSFLTN